MKKGSGKVAVIGGGVAGLTCARELARTGLEVTVFDKGRGPGGRLSTRRCEIGDERFGFDHGAQYFTARDPRFAELMVDMAAEGAVAPWRGRLARWHDGEVHQEEPASETRWVGTPGMSRVLRSMASRSGAEVRFGERITALIEHEQPGPSAASGDGSGARWRLETASDDDRLEHGFDRIVLAVPLTQAIELLPAHVSIEALSRVETAPCHTLMLALSAPVAADFDGLFVSDHPAASWLARNSSKPGRSAPADGEAWILQTTPEWSQKNLEAQTDSLAPSLENAFVELVGDLSGEVLHRAVHRWRYARTVEPLGEASIWLTELALGLCGDWCIGARVEAAFLSGLALAETMTGSTESLPGRRSP